MMQPSPGMGGVAESINYSRLGQVAIREALPSG